MFDADQLCDRVALLHQGKIRAIDTPQNLKIQYGKPGVTVTRRNETLKTYHFPMQGLARNRDFLKILEDEGLVSIHSQEATLEEVFVKLTGDQLV
jgi:fluoroquinolone transport system ATP-binding protein